MVLYLTTTKTTEATRLTVGSTTGNRSIQCSLCGLIVWRYVQCWGGPRTGHRIPPEFY